MNRRQVLVGAGVTLSLPLSGCLSESTEPKEHPEIPEPLTRDTVVDFVEEYDTVEYHNNILRSGNPNSISVSCDALFDRVIDSAFYVITFCGGSTQHDSFLRGSSVSEYGSYPRIYRVNDQRVRRVEVESIEGNGEYSLRIINFTDVEYELNLTVTSLTKSGAEQVLDEELDLTSETGLERWVDIPTDGEYEITVTLNGSRSSTFEWEAHDQSNGIGIYVTPAGAIAIGTFPNDMK